MMLADSTHPRPIQVEGIPIGPELVIRYLRVHVEDSIVEPTQTYVSESVCTGRDVRCCAGCIYFKIASELRGTGRWGRGGALCIACGDVARNIGK